MPIFHVKNPDGHVLEVNAPDGTTEQDAINYAQTNYVPSSMPIGQAAVREAGIFGRAVGPTLAGAGTGAAIGAFGGPLSPVTVPAGAVIGGIVGSMPGGVMDTGVNWAANKMGWAQPQTPTEKTMSAIDQGVAGAMTGIGAGSAMQAAGKSIPELAQYAAALMADKPVAQLGGAAGASALSSAIGQNGGGIGAQLGGGLVGGILGHNAVSMPTGLLRGGHAIFNPSAGIDRATGNTLYNNATDPNAAMNNMRNAPVYVPGSNPTAAQSSLDPGLIGIEKGVRQLPQPGAAFTSILNDQNTARQNAFTGIAGTPADLQAMEDNRNAVTGPLREDAFNLKNAPIGSATRDFYLNTDPSRMVNVDPVQAKLNAIAQTPKVNNPDVRTILGAAGDTISGATRPYDPAFAYELKKGMQTSATDLLNKNKGGVDITNPDNSQRLAGGTLGSVNKVLDQQIDQATGGKYQPYLDQYSAMSKPIDQAELLQKMQQGASVQGMDIHGNRQLTQAGMGRQMQNYAEAIKNTLTPEQQLKLGNIKSDLDRAQTANNVPGQAVGADTIRNAMMANLLGKLSTLPDNKLVGLVPFGKTAASWANKGLDAVYSKPAMSRLSEALQNPSDAAALMAAASAKRQQIQNSMTAKLLYGNVAQPYITTMGARQ